MQKHPIDQTSSTVIHMTRPPRLPAVILLAVVIMGTAACGVEGSADEGKRSSTTAKTTSTTEPGNRPEVTVSDAGTGPKTKLRLKLEKGARTNLAVKVTTAITQDISGRTQTVKVPPITEDIALRIVDVENGVASFHFEITGAKLDNDGSLSPQQARSVESNLEKLVGLSSDGKIDDRGATLSSDLRIPSSVPAALRQTLQQLSDQLGTLSVPLPEEAVGEGATWSTRTTAKLSGAEVAIRNEYRLTDVDGALFTLEVKQRQTARPQAFDLPTLPPGATARILDWDVTSSGTNTLELGNIFPEAELRSSGTPGLHDHAEHRQAADGGAGPLDRHGDHRHRQLTDEINPVRRSRRPRTARVPSVRRPALASGRARRPPRDTGRSPTTIQDRPGSARPRPRRRRSPLC